MSRSAVLGEQKSLVQVDSHREQKNNLGLSVFGRQFKGHAYYL